MNVRVLCIDTGCRGLCMCVCIIVCMCLYLCMNVPVSAYVWAMHVCLYLCMYVQIYKYTYIHTYISYIGDARACMYIYICVYTNTHTHTHTHAYTGQCCEQRGPHLLSRHFQLWLFPSHSSMLSHALCCALTFVSCAHANPRA